MGLGARFSWSRRRPGLAAVCPSGRAVSVATVVRSAGRPPRLTRCAVYPLPGDHPGDLRDSMRDLGLQRMACTSLIDSAAYSLLLVEAPQVPPSELRAAVRWRVRELIDFHIDDAVVDVFEVPNGRTLGRYPLMYAVAARAAAVRQRIDQLQAAGLDLSVIDIPELAQRNLAAMLPEDVGGVVLLHLGLDSGLMTLTRQGTLYLARSFDWGSRQLAHDDETGLLSSEAESRIETLAVEIQRSLDYYESQFAQPPVAGIVLGPLDRPLPGIDRMLAAQLGQPCRVLDLNDLLDVEVPLDAALQSASLPAVGAALRDETVVL